LETVKLTKGRSLLDEMNELVGEDLAILEELIKEDTEALQLIVDPEKIIQKPLNTWSELDFELLKKLYGDSKVIKDLMIKKAKERLITLESRNE
jgi:hypothetical protein